MLLRVADEQRGHPLEGEHLVLVDVNVELGQRARHHEARPVGVSGLGGGNSIEQIWLEFCLEILSGLLMIVDLVDYATLKS